MMPVASEARASVRFDWDDLDLYRFFAFAFGTPSRQRFDALAQPALQDSLPELWRRLGCAGEPPVLAWFADYEEYEATYIALFDVGVPEPPVPLFESAHDKTKPAQELALENTWFYEVLGLKSDPSRAVPDYLITQLEFLSAVRYARENAESSEARRDRARLESDFLTRHLLNWVPRARGKLAAAHPAFAAFMTLLEAFLRRRLDELRATVPGSAR